MTKGFQSAVSLSKFRQYLQETMDAVQAQSAPDPNVSDLREGVIVHSVGIITVPLNSPPIWSECSLGKLRLGSPYPPNSESE